jgi:hypothetical protein
MSHIKLWRLSPNDLKFVARFALHFADSIFNPDLKLMSDEYSILTAEILAQNSII